jgi:hypothetical protein
LIAAEADIRCQAEQVFDLITLRYTLTPGSVAGVTRVARVVTLTIPPSLRLVQPVLVRAFRAESARTLKALKALKAYADALASLPGLLL